MSKGSRRRRRIVSTAEEDLRWALFQGHITVPEFNEQWRLLKTTSKTSKQAVSCTSCYGYGLHAMGDPSPMGPMDAADGMPTIACPTCGSNANPFKTHD